MEAVQIIEDFVQDLKGIRKKVEMGELKLPVNYSPISNS